MPFEFASIRSGEQQHVFVFADPAIPHRVPGATMCDMPSTSTAAAPTGGKNRRYTGTGTAAETSVDDLMLQSPCKSFRSAGVGARRIERAWARSEVRAPSPDPLLQGERESLVIPPSPTLHPACSSSWINPAITSRPFLQPPHPMNPGRRASNSLCRFVPPARSISRYSAWNPGCPDWNTDTARSPGNRRTHRHRHRTVSG